MKDFEKILEEWENQNSIREPAKNTTYKKIKGSDPEDTSWLDLYPPDSHQVDEKEEEYSRPISEGSSIWKKKEPQDVVDLHGLTGKEARRALNDFVHSMQKRGLRKGLIIHGKGIHSNGNPVLKKVVKEFLTNDVNVGEFRLAKSRDGGSGATWFLLRQRSRKIIRPRVRS